MANEFYDAKAMQAATAPRSQLQRFHNAVKRDLLVAHVPRGGALLDLACGRGGDLRKWAAGGLSYVRALDVSAESLREAGRRRAALCGSDTTVEFEHADLRSAWHDPRRWYDAVSCMFALHYFFESEQTAQAVFETAARNLRPGGVFFGVVPDGQQINERTRECGVFDDGHMRVQATWQGPPRPFGSSYTCAVEGTVTQGSDVPEFLVYGSVMRALAEQAGLAPVALRGVAGLGASPDGVLYPLDPPYGPPEAACTSCYAAFAFSK